MRTVKIEAIVDRFDYSWVWRCPNCNNRVDVYKIKAPKEVTCSDCKEKFETLVNDSDLKHNYY